MKAKCPFCKNGCSKCSKCNNGYFETDFAEGIMYDLKCNKCGNIVGFHIDDGNDPPELDMSHKCCISCKDPQDLVWVLSGYSKNEKN